jgi:hypothetical protein
VEGMTRTNCTNCAKCTNCTNCTKCINCTKCKNCTKCTNCTNCTKCTKCTNCTHLVIAMLYLYTYIYCVKMSLMKTSYKKPNSIYNVKHDAVQSWHCNIYIHIYIYPTLNCIQHEDDFFKKSKHDYYNYLKWLLIECCVQTVIGTHSLLSIANKCI